MNKYSILVVFLGLAACQPMVPNDAASAWEQRNAAREAELTGAPTPAAEGQEVTPQVTQVDPEGGEIAASPNNPAPEIIVPPSVEATVINNVGISDEQDFDAVAERESIESDAERLQANRQRYLVIQPTDLPSRSGGVPNIVEYALQTNNPVGEPLYRRIGLRKEEKALTACARFASSDLAQQAFLARGGPIRDRLGVDPDGDGFACKWDPRPFRAVAGS